MRSRLSWGRGVPRLRRDGGTVSSEAPGWVPGPCVALVWKRLMGGQGPGRGWWCGVVWAGPMLICAL